MPNRDGTGPLGQGTFTGRGRGPCGAGLRNGFGSRSFERGFGMGRRNFGNVNLSNEEKKKMLEAELKEIEREKEVIKKSLEEMD